MNTKVKILVAFCIVAAATACKCADSESFSDLSELRTMANALRLRQQRLCEVDACIDQGDKLEQDRGVQMFCILKENTGAGTETKLDMSSHAPVPPNLFPNRS